MFHICSCFLLVLSLWFAVLLLVLSALVFVDLVSFRLVFVCRLALFVFVSSRFLVFLVWSVSCFVGAFVFCSLSGFSSFFWFLFQNLTRNFVLVRLSAFDHILPTHVDYKILPT